MCTYTYIEGQVDRWLDGQIHHIHTISQKLLKRICGPFTSSELAKEGYGKLPAAFSIGRPKYLITHACTHIHARASSLDFGEGNFSGKAPAMWTTVILVLIGLVPYTAVSYVHIYSGWVYLGQVVKDHYSLSLTWEETKSPVVADDR